MKRLIYISFFSLAVTALAQMQVKNSANSELFTITQAGNVGIGITNPVYRLSVLDNIYATRNILTGYQSGSTGGVYIARSTEYGIPAVQGVSPSFAGAKLAINPIGGQVGIGMVNPRGALHVWGGPIRVHNYGQLSSCSNGYTLYSGNAYLSDPGQFKFAETHASLGAVGWAMHYPWGNYASFIHSTGTGSMLDEEFTPESIMTITPNGRVGIGTTNPQALLEVTSQVTCGPITGKYASIVFGEASHASWPGRYSQWTQNLDFVSDETWRYRRDGAGAVIMIGGMGGCSSPVPDKGVFYLGIANPGTAGNTVNLTDVLLVQSSGMGILKQPGVGVALDVAGTVKCVNVVQTSDLRYKQNVRTVNDALAKVASMRGVTYNWRCGEYPEQNFKQGNQIGLIAQEVQKIVPEVVQTDEQGYLAVDYAKVVPLLIEAIKEMNIEIASLKAQLKK